MRTYDAVCRLCGHLNRSLYLEETGNFMECEQCHYVVPVTEFSDRFAGAPSTSLYNPLKQYSFADLDACKNENENRRL